MEQKKCRFHGIIPPVVTLFDGNGDFDWEANKQLTEYLISQGVHGILYMGSTGEFSSLSMQQRKKFVQEMVEYVDGRVPVLVGTGTASLTDTIELSQHAQQCGADGILVVNPYYWKFTEDQLFEYYTAVADSVDLSVLIYNIPLLTGQNLSPKLVAKLAESRENIVGIKDTIENLGHIRQLIAETKKVRDDFAVFAAFDDLILPALQLGAAGAINGTSVFAPGFSVDLYTFFQGKEYNKALDQHQNITALMPVYEYSQPLFIAIKEAVHQEVLGFDTPYFAPGLLLDQTVKGKVKELLGKTLANSRKKSPGGLHSGDFFVLNESLPIRKFRFVFLNNFSGL
jgi:2-dehydro-3-deoxy-D-pentonate aldolase